MNNVREVKLSQDDVKLAPEVSEYQLFTMFQIDDRIIVMKTINENTIEAN